MIPMHIINKLLQNSEKEKILKASRGKKKKYIIIEEKNKNDCRLRNHASKNTMAQQL